MLGAGGKLGRRTVAVSGTDVGAEIGFLVVVRFEFGFLVIVRFGVGVQLRVLVVVGFPLDRTIVGVGFQICTELPAVLGS